MCVFFLVIRENTILFQALPWEALWAHPPHSSRPQSRRKPTQGFTFSRRFQDRQQAGERVLGLDVFLCGARASDAVVLHVCARMLTLPSQCRVFALEDSVCSLHLPPGTRIQSGAQRESGKAFREPSATFPGLPGADSSV